MTRPAEAEQSEEEKVVTLRLFGSLDMGHCPLLAHVTQSLYALQHLHIVAVVEAVGETQPVPGRTLPTCSGDNLGAFKTAQDSDG